MASTNLAPLDAVALQVGQDADRRRGSLRDAGGEIVASDFSLADEPASIGALIDDQQLEVCHASGSMGKFPMRWV